MTRRYVKSDNQIKIEQLANHYYAEHHELTSYGFALIFKDGDSQLAMGFTFQDLNNDEMIRSEIENRLKVWRRNKYHDNYR